VFFTTPVLTTYKTPVKIHQQPVGDLGVLITTANKQSLYCSNGRLVAQRSISYIERIRVIQLTTELRHTDTLYLTRLFDLALLFPEQCRLTVW
jgi:hypothetical protein